jgi:hypothetical protein
MTVPGGDETPGAKVRGWRGVAKNEGKARFWYEKEKHYRQLCELLGKERGNLKAFEDAGLGLLKDEQASGSCAGDARHP